MQLDRTRIAIRERGLLETIDLALFVIREFAGPILACGLLAIVPLAPMAAMVRGIHGVALGIERLREAVIAAAVFRRAVHDLDDGAR